jgi:integrase
MNGKRRTKTKAPGVYRSVSGRYEIAYRDSDGRLRFETVGDNFEDAKARRAEVVGKLHRGERVARARGTFGNYAEEWLAGLNRRPRTLDAHRYALDRHLFPRFARRKLGDITTDDVARLVAGMQRDGYAEWTTVGALSTLSSCLGRAARRGLIPTNPVKALTHDERRKQKGREKRVLSEDEITAVLDAASDRFRPLVATMIFSGVRLGELLALRWQDVDTAEGFLRVRFQLSPKRELVELKTSSGRRDVVLIPQLASVLRAHRMASGGRCRETSCSPLPTVAAVISGQQAGASNMP